MIHVSLNPTGTGTVTLPTRSVPIEATSLRDARERAIRVLTEYAATSSMSLDVVALDAGETVMLTVTTDGRVTVNNTVDNGMYTSSTGDLKPLPPQDVAAFATTADEPSEPAGPPTAVPSETTTAVPPRPQASAEAAPTLVPTAQPTLDSTPHGDDSEAESVAELTHDLEVTVVRAPAPKGPTAALTFSTGEQHTITGSALIGRHPRAGEGERVDQLIAIPDITLSLSRTHCLVAWHGDSFWVLDRNSGNGTSIVRGDTTVSLDASKAEVLKDGDEVQIGEQTFTVALTGAVTARD